MSFQKGSKPPKHKEGCTCFRFECAGISSWKGRKHTKESNESNRRAHLGMRKSMVTEFKKGQHPWNWLGGSSTYRVKIVSSPRYRNWRLSVFYRDGFKCVTCGSDDRIQADHIEPWALFPKLRYNKSNGQTLCKPHHLEKTFGFDKWKMRHFNKYMDMKESWYLYI